MLKLKAGEGRIGSLGYIHIHTHTHTHTNIYTRTFHGAAELDTTEHTERQMHVYIYESESVNCSAVSDFVTPTDCSPPSSSVHGISQGREGVAIPLSRGSSWPRDWIWVSCIVGRFFTIWATREAYIYVYLHIYIYITESLWGTSETGNIVNQLHFNKKNLNRNKENKHWKIV